MIIKYAVVHNDSIEYKFVDTNDLDRSNHYAIDSLFANELGDDVLLLYGHYCCKNIGKNILVAYDDDSRFLEDNLLMEHISCDGKAPAGTCIICKVKSGVKDIELIPNSKFRSLTNKDVKEMDRFYESYKAIAI